MLGLTPVQTAIIVSLIAACIIAFVYLYLVKDD